MQKYSFSSTFKDMISSADMFRDFEHKHRTQIKELQKAYSKKKFVILGAGSSVETPGMNAYKFFPKLASYPLQVDEVHTKLPSGMVRFLVSNSGHTADVLFHADATVKNPTVIISSPRGYYGHDTSRSLHDVFDDNKNKSNWHFVEMISSKEHVDAALSSVMEETAIIQSIYDPKFFDGNIFSLIGDLVIKILRYEDPSIQDMISEAFNDFEYDENQLFITGPDKSCVAVETAIKAEEIIGGRVVPSRSLLTLHGQESSFRRGDVLLITFPSYWERDKNLDSLIERARIKGANVLFIDSINPGSFVSSLKTPVPSKVETYVNLAMVWKGLLDISSFLGIDPDKNKGTRKIGNEEI